MNFDPLLTQRMQTVEGSTITIYISLTDKRKYRVHAVKGDHTTRDFVTTTSASMASKQFDFAIRQYKVMGYVPRASEFV